MRSRKALVSGPVDGKSPKAEHESDQDLLESSGEVPNSVTLVSVLPACTKLCMVDLVGRFIGSRWCGVLWDQKPICSPVTSELVANVNGAAIMNGALPLITPMRDPGALSGHALVEEMGLSFMTSVFIGEGSLAANCIDNFVIFVNSGEASKAPEIDMPEVESLFSRAAPKSDHRNSNGKSNVCVLAGSKFDKVQLIEQQEESR
ncbi:hypothetical protein AAG906_005555 [Vitis piasezkii]